MKTLFLILLLSIGIYTQPPLSEYEPISRNDTTAFLVKKDPRLYGDTVGFTLLMAQIIKDAEGRFRGFNSAYYMEYKAIAKCNSRTIILSSGEGVWEGLPYKSGKESLTKVTKGSPLDKVLIKVCRIDTFL